MKKNLKNTIITITFCFFLSISSHAKANDHNQSKEVKIGFVTFLSGAAATPFGIPARNAATIIVEAINQGTMPTPYSSKGLAGIKIKPIFIDENSKDKVGDYQKLVRKSAVDIVIGYISSGSCKAIAPVAERERKLTLLAICGTPQIFEEVNRKPAYVFRTFSHSTTENVAAAKYVIDTLKEFSSVAGINQNYSWGQDSWRDFLATIKSLKQNVTVSTEQFPKLFAGDYETELSVVTAKKPSVVHSSFWGNDAEALVIQGGINNVFSNSKLIMTAGDTAIHRLGPQIPDGTIMGGRGPTGQLAPESELNDWFKKVYFQRFGSFPTHPAYFMAQSILAVKAAADQAGSADQNRIKAKLKGLDFASPSGKVSMALSGGHQAITGTAYGTYKYDDKTGKGKLVNIKRYNAACVNPPNGVKSIDWIKSGFKGSSCK